MFKKQLFFKKRLNSRFSNLFKQAKEIELTKPRSFKAELIVAISLLVESEDSGSCSSGSK